MIIFHNFIFFSFKIKRYFHCRCKTYSIRYIRWYTEKCHRNTIANARCKSNTWSSRCPTRSSRHCYYWQCFSCMYRFYLCIFVSFEISTVIFCWNHFCVWHKCRLFNKNKSLNFCAIFAKKIFSHHNPMEFTFQDTRRLIVEFQSIGLHSVWIAYVVLVSNQLSMVHKISYVVRLKLHWLAVLITCHCHHSLYEMFVLVLVSAFHMYSKTVYG